MSYVVRDGGARMLEKDGGASRPDGRPPMAPEPEVPDPGEQGPVPPMRNPGDPARPTPPDAPVPDPDDPQENPDPGPDRAPGHEPFPDRDVPNP